MYITTNSYHVFGSGSAWASLKIDGVRVQGDQDEGHNGFIGYVSADVPISALRAARKIEYSRGAYPGGGRKFVGSGRQFLRWYRGCKPLGEDPLLHARRLRAAKAAQARFAKWKAGLHAWALSTGRAALRDDGQLVWRETFRLPDGCRGGRWTWFQPPNLPYPDPPAR